MGNTSKVHFEAFYKKLRRRFPKLERLPVWDEWDWSNESDEQCVVISKVAREMTRWAYNNEFQEVRVLLNEIEKAFSEADECVVAYIGTDFLVTIMEIEDKPVREQIKALMQERTYKAYQANFGFYRESN